jgi:hypothetical protein
MGENFMYDNSGTVVLSTGGVAVLGHATGVAALATAAMVVLAISLIARVVNRRPRREQ